MSKLVLHTELNAEDNAMLQALYSRSPASVTDHIEKIKQIGSGKFMSSYYLGYGHASIGDCGSDTMYFEGISMLAAKAIEDNQLFVGQECSSRYIDFSTQHFYDPYRSNTKESMLVGKLYHAYREFYTSSLEPLKADLRTRFPKKEEDKDAVYEKAIAARAFDILRGFLPAGATTNVAWTFRFSNADEHLRWMMHHPLAEVRGLGLLAYKKIHTKYPNSFKSDYAELIDAKFAEQVEGTDRFEYLSQFDHFYMHFRPEEDKDQKPFAKLATDRECCYVDLESDFYEIADENQSFKNRLRKTPLPKHCATTRRTMYVSGVIDFGSFRDLQRHRNMICSMPLLTGQYGLHSWYFDNLPAELQEKAMSLLEQIETTYKSLNVSNSDQELAQLQYILPMGFCVGYAIRCTVNQAVYLAELRSGKTVHATLRPHAQLIGQALEEMGVPIFYDKEESNWTIKRGEQDIVAKG